MLPNTYHIVYLGRQEKEAITFFHGCGYPKGRRDAVTLEPPGAPSPARGDLEQECMNIIANRSKLINDCNGSSTLNCLLANSEFAIPASY